MKNKENRYKEEKYFCAFCNEEKDYSYLKYMGSSFNDNYIYFVKNKSNHICIDCLEQMFFKCNICKKSFHKITINQINNKSINICSNCLINGFHKCKKCNCFIEKDKELCLKCFKINFFKCNRCERIFSFNKMKCFKGYCLNCIPKIANVKLYSFKPEVEFFGYEDDKDELFLGCEIELSMKKPRIELNKFCIEAKNKFLYFKNDSSIANNGIEIVSQPANYSFHIKSRIWHKTLQKAFKYNLKGHSSCGIHIHMNRDFFTRHEIALLDQFINNNDDFFTKISGRKNKENRFCKYVRKSFLRWGIADGDRYCALNLTNNNTIEIRIFQSTNNVNKFINYLTICHALAYFVKTITKVDKHTLNLFKDFIYNKYNKVIE